jgi:outer membrane protein assembly factor BamB
MKHLKHKSVWLIALATAAVPAFLNAQLGGANASRSLRVAQGKLPAKLRPHWKFKTGGPVVSSAAVSGNRAVIGSGDGNVYAINLRTGGRIWAYKTGAEIEASPLILGNAVYIGAADGILYCLDAAKGTLRWKYKTDDKILGGANYASAPSGKGTWILVGSYDNRLHCINAATGRKVWTYETDNYINGSPAVAGNRVIFGGCDGLLHVVNLADGKKIRSIEVGEYVAGTAALAGRIAYLGHYGNEGTWNPENYSGDIGRGAFLTSRLRQSPQTAWLSGAAISGSIACAAPTVRSSGTFEPEAR